MGLFGFFKGKSSGQSWEEKYAWDGNESMTCPRCGGAMRKAYSCSDWWCDACHAGLDDDSDEDDGETLSVYDAADIWLSNGKDEDYMFGYSEEELESALR